MLDFGFYNMDCMEGLKDFPDNYFNLAIVDPPYGSGLIDGGGWFEKYKLDNSVEKSGGVRTLTDSVNGLTATKKHLQKKNCRKPDGTWGYPNWQKNKEDLPKKS